MKSSERMRVGEHYIVSDSRKHGKVPGKRHRGNTYLRSIPLVSVHHHGRVNSVKVEINFTSSASSIFQVHNIADVIMFPNVDSFCHARNICVRHTYCALDT